MALYSFWYLAGGRYGRFYPQYRHHKLIDVHEVGQLPVPDDRNWNWYRVTPARLLCAMGLLAANAYSGRVWGITAAVDALAANFVR